jgi:DNA replication protein DnaC
MLDWSLDGIWSRNGRGDGPCLAALDILDRGRGWLTFWGKPGVGKTYLLAAVVNEARKRDMPAVYTTMAELLDDFRRTFDPGSPVPFAALWEAVTTAQVLAVDELEKFNTTDWAEERFFMLIEKRYREADQLLTIFATNKRVERGFMMMDDSYAAGYLESRLTDGRFAVVEIGGGDVRPGLQRK